MAITRKLVMRERKSRKGREKGKREGKSSVRE